MWASTGSLKQLLCRLQRRETKVDNLYVTITIDQDVLRLHVSVTDAISVAVGETSQQLSENPNSFRLVEMTTSSNVAEKLSTFDEFEDKVSNCLLA